MKTLFIVLPSLLLMACANLMPFSDENQRNQTSALSELKKDSFHSYISALANQLFYSGNRLQLNETIAVGSFLPIDDLQGKKLPQGSSLGQQIQESMVTLATQAGMNVIEFKTTNTLKLENNLDIMLSRDLDKINKNIGIDYFLTGTYTFAHNGLSINARLIDVTNSSVVAAATDVIPGYVAMSLAGQTHHKQQTFDHQLYHLK